MTKLYCVLHETENRKTTRLILPYRPDLDYDKKSTGPYDSVEQAKLSYPDATPSPTWYKGKIVGFVK